MKILLALLAMLSAAHAAPLNMLVMGGSGSPPQTNFYLADSREAILNSPKLVTAHYVPNGPRQVSQSDYWPNSSCMVNQLQSASFAATAGNMRICSYPAITSGSGPNWKRDDFVTDIRAALAQGINGFVLDIGAAAAWGSGGDLVEMLAASLVVDPAGRFKIVPMPDMGYYPAITPTILIGMWGASTPDGYTVYTHPAMYRWAGKPVLSVLKPEQFGGFTVANWQTALNTMTSNGNPISWWPCFGSITDAPTYVTGITQSVGVMNFGNPGVPDQYLYASTQPGQMASNFPGMQLGWGFTTHAWQVRSGTYYEPVNSTAYRYAWQAARVYLSSSPLLMIVTWNDSGEGTTLRPSMDWAGNVTDGLYKMTGFFAQWWRRGVQPTIIKDAIFWAYNRQTYAQAHAATCSGCTTFPTVAGWNAVATPSIEAVAFLTAPATLQIANGTNYTQSCASAGVCTMGKATYTAITSPTPAIGDATAVPLAAGTPVFSVIRNSVTSISATGIQTYGAGQVPAGTGPQTVPNGVCTTNPCFLAGAPDMQMYSGGAW